MTISAYAIPGIDVKKKMSNPNFRRGKIIDVICSYYQLSETALFTRRRYRRIVFPRQVCHVMLKKYTHLNVVEVAKMFKMDHTSIINSWKVVRNLCETDEEIKKQIIEIENAILS